MNADLQSRLQKQVVPLTAVVVILAIAACKIPWLSPGVTHGDIVSRFFALIAVCVLLLPFPALPLLTGWYSGNRVIAVLAGILPLPLFFIAGFFLNPAGDMEHLVSGTIPFALVLSALAGLAGYCAALRMKEYLAISVVLSGLWLVLFLGGIN